MRKLSEDLDTEVPRSNYVNILMEIGISRRSAYRLVDEAYKAKFTRSVQPAKTTSPVAIPALTASSAHNPPASYEQLPSVPPVGKKITWPPEVEAVINGAKANIIDLMVAAYSVGVMRGKEEVTKEEVTKPLEAITSRAEHMGSFLRAAIIDATRDGVIDGRDGIYKKRSPVERFLTVQGCPEFAGKPVSVFVPSGKKIAAENAWDRVERKRAENERLDGLLAPNTTSIYGIARH